MEILSVPTFLCWGTSVVLRGAEGEVPHCLAPRRTQPPRTLGLQPPQVPAPSRTRTPRPKSEPVLAARCSDSSVVGSIYNHSVLLVELGVEEGAVEEGAVLVREYHRT